MPQKRADAGAAATMEPGDRWGPFSDDIAPGERVARLRALRAIVRLLCGPRGAEAQAALLAAERRPEADPAACAAVMALEPIDRRRVDLGIDLRRIDLGILGIDFRILRIDLRRGHGRRIDPGGIALGIWRLDRDRLGGGRGQWGGPWERHPRPLP